MDTVSKDAREDEITYIDVVVSTAWAGTDQEAEKQTRDSLRILRRAENFKQQVYGNVMPFAVPDVGTLGNAAKRLLAHLASPGKREDLRGNLQSLVQKAQTIVLMTTAKGAMASREITTTARQGA